jgi:hypothetical protein
MITFAAIKRIYPNITWADVWLQDDGNGPYIYKWEFDQPVPTDADIEAAYQLEVIKERVDGATSRINAAYSLAFAAIRGEYPEEERESWPTQVKEAAEWTASNTIPTPWIDAASEARGISKADLAAKILVKAAAYQALSGQLTGKRQKLIDQIIALGNSPTQEQLDAIQW